MLSDIRLAQNRPMLDHQENGATHLPPEAPVRALTMQTLS